MKDIIITDFSDRRFRDAFIEYFNELEIEIEDWESLFKMMNEEKDNVSIIMTNEDDETIGFIQFKIDYLNNWFFKEKVGFIREFWISKTYRKMGHGNSLLNSAERYFIEKEVYKAILTTDTASDFYKANGYVKDSSYTALNEDDVYVKLLK